MKIGLFLDVDKTLTKNFIQHEYAKLLGCESEYKSIESEFQNKTISSVEFGQKIIDVLRKYNFKRDFAIENFDNVELATWTDKLLKMNIDKFLISSGPSYYIDELAQRYNIPNDRICRSEYIFDQNTKIIKSCHAINDQQKADFVRSKISNYTISIGIGDHPEFDGPFISLCSIPILTVPKDGYLYVSSFSTAVSLIERIASIGNYVVGTLEIDKMTPYQLIKNLSIKSLSVLIAIIISSFSAGGFFYKYFIK